MALMLGDPAPWFTTASNVNPNFHMDTVAGRYCVLCFIGSSENPAARRILEDAAAMKKAFDVVNWCLFTVSNDPRDAEPGRLDASWPGIIHFHDPESKINRLYGLNEGETTPLSASPQAFILDPGLRVIGIVRGSGDAAEFMKLVAEYIQQVPPVSAIQTHAPVLVVPWVFEREFCRMLIDLYEKHGGSESGFMQDINGKTTAVMDYGRKRRSDYEIADSKVIQAAQQRLKRRLVPQIKRAFQFDATRIERHIVACYDGSEAGHFKAHRDNTTKGTAHRRFAVTINLNSEDYEGGDLRFGEFGLRTYRAPTGGAVVFSCSLLHEAMPVTRGRRYAFLPFLYDDAAAMVRQENLKYLAGNTTPVQAGT